MLTPRKSENMTVGGPGFESWITPSPPWQTTQTLETCFTCKMGTTIKPTLHGCEDALRQVHVKIFTHTQSLPKDGATRPPEQQVARHHVGAGVLFSLQPGKGLMGTWWVSNHDPGPQVAVCFVSAAEGPSLVPGVPLRMLKGWTADGGAPGWQLARPLPCEPSTPNSPEM